MKKEDVKIILDAGHGGSDPGTSGNGIIEKDLALQITLYMYDRLRELGIPVKITRTTDETLTPTERVSRVLNAWGSDPNVILISNHLNASGNKGADGAEVIYAKRNTDELPKQILRELQKEGQNIRSAYTRNLPSDPRKDYYFMQRNTAPIQSMTVEYGFLDSNKDDPAQLKNNYRNYVDAVIRALLEYLNIEEESIPVTGNTYVVKRGDTLYGIANKYNTTVDTLKNINNLTSNTLSVGEILTLPGGNMESLGEDFELYIVKRGDTLSSIARNYGILVSDLIQYNGLTSDVLSVGTQLLIPKTSAEPPTFFDTFTYTVKSGDSLWRIANIYNVTVDDIKRANNLSNNLLKIGQVLVIPNTSNTYTVQKGDSLWKIAFLNNTTVDELKRKNNLTSDLLSVGQVLIL